MIADRNMATEKSHGMYINTLFGKSTYRIHRNGRNDFHKTVCGLTAFCRALPCKQVCYTTN